MYNENQTILTDIRLNNIDINVTYIVQTKMQGEVDWGCFIHSYNLNTAINWFEDIYYSFRRDKLRIINCKTRKIVYE